MEIASIFSIFFDPEETFLELIMEMIIYPVIILGVFGYAYGKRIFFNRLWIAMIPIGLSYDIYGFATLDWTFGSTEEMLFTAGLMAAIILPLVFCQYLALYGYSFKSPEIWQ